MSKKLPVNNFEGSKILVNLMKNLENTIMKKTIKGIFFEVDVQYLKKLHGFHNDLLFLSVRMKIEKFEKLVSNLHDKTEYVIHIRNLNKALN